MPVAEPYGAKGAITKDLEGRIRACRAYYAIETEEKRKRRED